MPPLRQLYTDEVPDFDSLPKADIPFVYSTMDACCQKELEVNLRRRVSQSPEAALICSFEHAMLGPAFEMMQNGFLIDPVKRDRAMRRCSVRLTAATDILNRLAQEVWQDPINANSSKQLPTFLYDRCGFPEQKVLVKVYGGGYEYRRSANKEALANLFEECPESYPFISLIQAIRAYGDSISVLRSKIDNDWHIHYQFNPQGTSTGRFSSNSTPRGYGTNGQNLENLIRTCHVAEPGNILISVDKSGAESLAVAKSSGDTNYYKAATSPAGVHAFVCQMIWPEYGWPEDPRNWKSFAQTIPFDELHDLYDMGKRAGHASNYAATYRTIARHLKIKEAVAADFQRRYFTMFPKIRSWQAQKIEQVQTKGYIITPLGRKISFLGRATDHTMHKKAIAAEPQSLIADDLNFGLWRLWHRIHDEDLPIILRLQVHDEIVCEVPENYVGDAIEVIKDCLLNEIPFPDGPLVIPIACKIGWCWADYNDDSTKGELELDGLRTWTGTIARTRAIYPSFNILDRLVC